MADPAETAAEAPSSTAAPPIPVTRSLIEYERAAEVAAQADTAGLTLLGVATQETFEDYTSGGDEDFYADYADEEYDSHLPSNSTTSGAEASVEPDTGTSSGGGVDFFTTR
jgi:hypothetical protein